MKFIERKEGCQIQFDDLRHAANLRVAHDFVRRSLTLTKGVPNRLKWNANSGCSLPSWYISNILL